MIGAGTRLLGSRITVPPWAAPTALASLGTLSVVPLRGQLPTYLAGGPVIAVLTAVLLLSWRIWTRVTVPVVRPLAVLLAVLLTLVAVALSWCAVERPLHVLRRRAGVLAA